MEVLPNEIKVVILELCDSISVIRLVCKRWKRMIHAKFLLSPRGISRLEHCYYESASTLDILKSRAKRLGIDVTSDQLIPLIPEQEEVRDEIVLQIRSQVPGIIGVYDTGVVKRAINIVMLGNRVVTVMGDPVRLK